MKYAHYDTDTREILGWYDDSHVEIPEPNMEVDFDPWEVAVTMGHNTIDENGVTSYQDRRSLEEQIEAMRLLRDKRLKDTVDPIVCNPLRWNSLSEEEQAAWADYRTALLTLPEQEGFPKCEFPVPPTGEITDVL